MCEEASPGLLEPYERLIGIEVLGRLLEVPENNLLLRQLQFVAPEIGFGKYCWNGECRYCEIAYRREGHEVELSALACRIKGFPGMRITRLAAEIRYNLGSALARAKRVR